MDKEQHLQQKMLKKLGITQLNPMQEEMQLAVPAANNVMLLSPTGSGKTLAFLLPIISLLDTNNSDIQVLILTPSRELAIQIEQVTRNLGSGYKTNAVYGGRPFSKDVIDLKHPPSILIGTPGRVADHIKRGTINIDGIHTLVLDEFDKSLEVGFEIEMKSIIKNLPALEKRILTSATEQGKIPGFVGMENPLTIDYSKEAADSKLALKTIVSPAKDKLQTLVKTLKHLGNQPGIIFCNFKDSIQRLSEQLEDEGIPHGCFYGGMEQRDRERALIKFRNGTHQLIIATDLAARGIDISELKFIIHYHLPLKAQEFTHRNGRTARMHSEGTAYVIHWQHEKLPDFITETTEEVLNDAPLPTPSPWKTLFISGGRKDKISKGDIVGLCCKQGQLKADALGIIELKQDCAFVAVKHNNINELISKIDQTRLKKKKVRVRLI